MKAPKSVRLNQAMFVPVHKHTAHRDRNPSTKKAASEGPERPRPEAWRLQNSRLRQIHRSKARPEEKNCVLPAQLSSAASSAHPPAHWRTERPRQQSAHPFRSRPRLFLRAWIMRSRPSPPITWLSALGGTRPTGRGAWRSSARLVGGCCATWLYRLCRLCWRS